MNQRTLDANFNVQHPAESGDNRNGASAPTVSLPTFTYDCKSHTPENEVPQPRSHSFVNSGDSFDGIATSVHNTASVSPIVNSFDAEAEEIDLIPLYITKQMRNKVPRLRNKVDGLRWIDVGSPSEDFQQMFIASPHIINQARSFEAYDEQAPFFDYANRYTTHGTNSTQTSTPDYFCTSNAASPTFSRPGMYDASQFRQQPPSYFGSDPWSSFDYQKDNVFFQSNSELPEIGKRYEHYLNTPCEQLFDQNIMDKGNTSVIDDREQPQTTIDWPEDPFDQNIPDLVLSNDTNNEEHETIRHASTEWPSDRHSKDQWKEERKTSWEKNNIENLSNEEKNTEDRKEESIVESANSTDFVIEVAPENVDIEEFENDATDNSACTGFVKRISSALRKTLKSLWKAVRKGFRCIRSGMAASIKFVFRQ